MKKISLTFSIAVIISLISSFCLAEIPTSKLRAAKINAINSLRKKPPFLKEKPYAKFNNNINNISPKSRPHSEKKNIKVIKPTKSSNNRLDLIKNDSNNYIKSVDNKLEKLNQQEASIN